MNYGFVRELLFVACVACCVNGTYGLMRFSRRCLSVRAAQTVALYTSTACAGQVMTFACGKCYAANPYALHLRLNREDVNGSVIQQWDIVGDSFSFDCWPTSVKFYVYSDEACSSTRTCARILLCFQPLTMCRIYSCRKPLFHTGKVRSYG